MGDEDSTLGSKWKHFYRMQLIVKDQDTLNSTTLYKVFLITHQGRGDKFIPIPATDLTKSKNHKQLTGLKNAYKLLTSHNAILDVIVEKVECPSQTLFQIVDTIIDSKLMF